MIFPETGKIITCVNYGNSALQSELLSSSLILFCPCKGDMMQVSVRSYLTAGVAFVGAGAIALTPIQPLERTVELRAAVTHSANVALTSTQNPIQLWLDVLQTSAGNVGALGQAVLAAPAPVLGQAIKNQIGYGRAVFEGLEAGANQALDALKTLPASIRDSLTYFAAGNIVDGVQSLLNPVMGVGLAVLLPIVPIVESISAMAQNLANIVGTIANPSTVLAFVLSIGGPILSAVNAVVEQAQDVVNGLKTGNLGNVIKAVLNIPAAVVGGILNGHGNIVFSGIPLPAAGLLTPFDNILSTGIFGALQNLRVEIGNAIKPPAPELMSVLVTDSAPEVEDAGSADVLAGAESEGTDAIEVEVVSEVTETEELSTEDTETEAVTETVALEEESSADDLLAGDDEEVAEDTPKSIADEREALTGSDDEDEDAESEAGSGSTSTGGGAGGSGGLSGEADGDADGADTDAGDSGGDAGGDSGGDSGSSGGGSSE
ncbi:hypothetical protein [Mycolicibacterium diernhoferi]|uniref:hypothetical protein n=1 Tax=Mycolicibacterium diernhoferi TaxID=1801 RepID=UPI001C65C40E|nr:hypothetical protein [Mycolicibacterium diernhoferi]QYL21641.1 hypothetical protein K0O62_21975 [Mycolicibacterium diernhoferi]